MMIFLNFFLFFSFLWFKGPIPTEIGKLIALETFNANINKLTGIYGTYTCHLNFQSARVHANKTEWFGNDFAHFFFIFLN